MKFKSIHVYSDLLQNEFNTVVTLIVRQLLDECWGATVLRLQTASAPRWLSSEVNYKIPVR